MCADPGFLIETSKFSRVDYYLFPVRYRPNAASGGWSYGRDLRQCREKGNTLFEPVTSSYQIFIRQLNADICMAVVL